jgi:hypothetical protein
MAAAAKGHTDCVRMLLEAGADREAKTKVCAICCPICVCVYKMAFDLIVSFWFLKVVRVFARVVFLSFRLLSSILREFTCDLFSILFYQCFSWRQYCIAI